MLVEEREKFNSNDTQCHNSLWSKTKKLRAGEESKHKKNGNKNYMPSISSTLSQQSLLPLVNDNNSNRELCFVRFIERDAHKTCYQYFTHSSHVVRLLLAKFRTKCFTFRWLISFGSVVCRYTVKLYTLLLYTAIRKRQNVETHKIEANPNNMMFARVSRIRVLSCLNTKCSPCRKIQASE